MSKNATVKTIKSILGRKKVHINLKRSKNKKKTMEAIISIHIRKGQHLLLNGPNLRLLQWRNSRGARGKRPPPPSFNRIQKRSAGEKKKLKRENNKKNEEIKKGKRKKNDYIILSNMSKIQDSGNYHMLIL